MQTEDKVFNDCVHGHIKLSPMCVKIVDTLEFQRLRNVKQVGPVYHVYPGASHNRFEHSLGVCYLAGQMVEALRRNCNDPGIVSEDEKLCLEVAGLCHDLGHGPFSHTWERFIKAATNKKKLSGGGNGIQDWKHEESSLLMFEYLLKKNNLHSELTKALPNLKGEGVAFVKELIKGEGTIMKTKKFLYQIISNKENGIDVDRWDYFLRDGLQLNMKFTFDYRRLLEFCRVVEVNGEKKICFRNKEAQHIYDMFLVRSKLHYIAYHHHVAECIEEMFIDALVEADDKGYKICLENGKIYKLSEAHLDIEALSCMTDHIFYNIMYSVEEEFKQARMFLHRIQKREFYKIVGCKNFSTELVRATQTCSNTQDINDKINEEIKKYEQELKEIIKNICQSMTYCRAEYFKVCMIKLDLGITVHDTSGNGRKKMNPFSNIYFYDKKNLNEAQKLEWKDVPIFFIPEESICRIDGLIIYKDIQEPLSENDALKMELEKFEVKLKEQW